MQLAHGSNSGMGELGAGGAALPAPAEPVADGEESCGAAGAGLGAGPEEPPPLPRPNSGFVLRYTRCASAAASSA